MRNNARRSQDSELGKKCCRHWGPREEAPEQKLYILQLLFVWRLFTLPVTTSHHSACWLWLGDSYLKLWLWNLTTGMIFCCKWLPLKLYFGQCMFVCLLLSENYMPQFRAHIISAPPIIGILISWLVITCGWGWAGVINCQSGGHNDDKHKHNADNTSNSRTSMVGCLLTT